MSKILPELGNQITLQVTGVSIIEREPAVVVTTLSNAPPEAKQNSLEGTKASEVPASTPEKAGDPPKEVDEKNKHGEGEALKGRKVSKKFGRKYYDGEVISYDPETHWYKVEYEDGDSEELWWWELQYLLLPETGSKKRGRKPFEGDKNQSSGKRVKEQSVPSSPPRARKRHALEIRIDLTLVDESRGKKEKKRVQESRLKNKTNRTPEASASPASRTLSSSSDDDEGPGARLHGRETRKELIKGRITSFDPKTKLYKVSCEDGTEENLSWKEVKASLLSTEEKTSDPAGPESSSFVVVQIPEDDIQAETGAKQGDIQLETAATHTQEQNIQLETTETHTPGEDTKLETPAETYLQDETAARLEDAPETTFDLKSHPAFLVSRYSLENAEKLRFHAWGEVVGFDKGKCPELRAVKWLPSASPIVHLAASHHHLAALTAAGQVWVWRNKHGNIQERCNQWEHIPDLDDKSIMLIDIAGQDLDRSSAGYKADEEDQVPDPFYLAAVSKSGRDYIFQGSHPHEPVHTRSLVEEAHNLSLQELLKVNELPVRNMGRIVQVSVGAVEKLDEPPFIGHITDSDRVYIRSATKDFTEEVNHITGFSGKPLKIQCGRVYHAIIMTDDGCAWTWRKGPDNPGSLCHPAHAALFGRKVIDVGCCGENYIALTEDGEVHQWTHGDSLTINVNPITSAAEDPLRKIVLGEGLSAGISSWKKLHTWRTFSRAANNQTSTPSGRDDNNNEDAEVTELGTMPVLEVLCVPGSLIAIGEKKAPAAAPKTTAKAFGA